MGPRPAATSLDRENTLGNYTPSNCRWATATVQARNCRNTYYVAYDGQRKSLAEWAELLGKPYHRLYVRLRKLGWGTHRAFTT